MINVLNMLVGQEVFVVASDESTHASIVKERTLYVCDSAEELREKMKELETCDGDELRVIHGVLTHAAALPSDLCEKTAFVLIANAMDEEDGYLVEAGDTVEHIEGTVTDVLKNGVGELDNVEIEEMFVVYGYELQIVLCFNDDDMDEEILDSCHQIAEEAETVYDRNQSELENPNLA